MPVIRDAFSQQAADTTHWADTIDWTVRYDWLRVASSRIISYTHPGPVGCVHWACYNSSAQESAQDA